MSIFVDTGAWYALADRADRHHDEASRFCLSCAGRVTLVTSHLIVAETWTLISSHIGRPAALTVSQTLRDIRLPIHAIQDQDVEAAWRIVEAFPDHDFGFTGCTSFALMERFRIEEALRFDRHFLVYRYGHLRRRAFRVANETKP